MPDHGQPQALRFALSRINREQLSTVISRWAYSTSSCTSNSKQITPTRSYLPTPQIIPSPAPFESNPQCRRIASHSLPRSHRHLECRRQQCPPAPPSFLSRPQPLSSSFSSPSSPPSRLSSSRLVSLPFSALYERESGKMKTIVLPPPSASQLTFLPATSRHILLQMHLLQQQHHYPARRGAPGRTGRAPRHGPGHLRRLQPQVLSGL